MAKAKKDEVLAEEIAEVSPQPVDESGNIIPPPSDDALTKETEEQPESPDDDVPVHIPSNGRPWISIDGVKHITGSVNSESFQVRCDEPTTIKRKFYGAVKPLVQ